MRKNWAKTAQFIIQLGQRDREVVVSQLKELWNRKIWSRVPEGLEPRTTVPARTSSNLPNMTDGTMNCELAVAVGGYMLAMSTKPKEFPLLKAITK